MLTVTVPNGRGELARLGRACRRDVLEAVRLEKADEEEVRAVLSRSATTALSSSESSRAI